MRLLRFPFAVMTLGLLLAGPLPAGALTPELVEADARVDQRLHDAWVNREKERCRRHYDSVRAQMSCMNRLRPQIDRRQCEVFRRTDWRREVHLGIPAGRAEDTRECKLFPRPVGGC